MTAARRGFWLPPGLPAPAATFRDTGEGIVEVPDTSPALVMTATAHLRAARPGLLALSTDTILHALEETVAGWMRPDAPDREAAEAAFCAATGLPRASAPYTPLLEVMTGAALRAWLNAEVTPVEALEKFVPGPGGAPVRATGPALAVHILSGNVPLVWLPGLAACLLMRTPCLLKPATDDPLTAPLFAAALARRCPALGEALAVLPWTGGEAAIEAEAMGQAEAVFVYGGGAAVAGILARTPAGATRSVHGPRTAAGAIARETLAPGRLEPVAGAAARDALLYDGRGCLSLSCVFIERDGLMNPREAVTALAQALAGASANLPPGRPDRDAAAVTQSWRARARARALAGRPAACLASPAGLDWTVIYDEEIPPPDAALVRTVWASPVDDLAGLSARLAALPVRAHAVALAAPDRRRATLAADLPAVGVTRIVPFGRLQAPPVDWAADGVSPFRRHLRWTRLEA